MMTATISRRVDEIRTKRVLYLLALAALASPEAVDPLIRLASEDKERGV